MEIATMLGLIAVGFIAGYIVCSLLSIGQRVDDSLYDAAIMDLHKQLDEANETIFNLSNEKAKLMDSLQSQKGG